MLSDVKYVVNGIIIVEVGVESFVTVAVFVDGKLLRTLSLR